MGGWLRFLKEVASVCIISAFMVLVYRALQPGTSNVNRDIEQVKRDVADYPVVFAGKRLFVKGMDLTERPYTFFLFLSPDCEVCRQSASSHERLLSEAASRSVSMFVALPTAREGQSFLASVGITDAKTIGWRDLNMRVVGTPSLVLADRNGIVLRVWLGKLDAVAESAVLDAIRDPTRVSLPVRRLRSGELLLKPDELRRIALTRNVKIISIRQRGSFARDHASEAINIPLDELAARAPIELKGSDLNVVDCSAEIDAQCSLAVRVLADGGFEAAALDRSTIVARE